MRGIVALLLLMPVAAHAGKIVDSSVTLEDGVYAIDVEAVIGASPDIVMRLLTDYDHLHAINSSIRESRIIHTYSPVKHRVRTLIRACILFFCRSVHQVQDIEKHGEHRLVADIIPHLSDFRLGRAEWRLAVSGADTAMHFTAQLEPAFWVPPVIGPWLFRHKIVSELLESAAHMEMAALEPVAR
ncbi:MAG: SRPBCC family protein [Gammaproteobacteria bacterium]